MVRSVCPMWLYIFQLSHGAYLSPNIFGIQFLHFTYHFLATGLPWVRKTYTFFWIERGIVGYKPLYFKRFSSFYPLGHFVLIPESHSSNHITISFFPSLFFNCITLFLYILWPIVLEIHFRKKIWKLNFHNEPNISFPIPLVSYIWIFPHKYN